MSDTTERSLVAAASARPPFYRDAVVVKWLAQVTTLVLVVFAIVFLAVQAGDNLEAKGIDGGFDFLEVNPGINLNGTIDNEPDTGGRALYAGMVNTIRLAVGGILLATILGIVVGVARLSNNWVVSKTSSVFIEYERNIPLLVHIIIFFAVLTGFENFSEDVGPINGWLHFSNKGVSVPRIHIADGFYQWMVFILIGAIIGAVVRRRRQAEQDATGATTYPGLSMLGVIAVFGAIGWFLHPIFSWVGGIFDAIADGIDAVPAGVVQVLLTVLAVGLAADWIRRFLNSRRTPAGLAKLTDDDYFRMIFAGFGALVATVFIWVIWPGGSSWLVNSGRDLFEVLGDKFDSDRDGGPFGLGRPDFEQRGNFVNPGPGGLNFSQGFAAVFFGIVLYTAAFIAEIVRAGILAVPKGQTEAAQAIGLKRGTMLRRVILPQAFRVSLPPLGNQYLNLTKNTSLAIAVGATDLVQVGQTVYNQTGRSLEVFAIWMGFYLACSLTISVVVNFFNVRLAIVER
ncbi:MAG: ABC transporter permease subunit [Actinomycetota bacterium]